MALALYNALLTLGGPLLDQHLKARLKRGKEDPKRFPERMGMASRPRPRGTVIWIHAASVGESVSALPLIEGLLAADDDRHVLLTTGTRTSAEIMAGRLPARAFHQYVPLDRKKAVRLFLDHWTPDLAIWMESELWPNLIHETGARRIPMLLVNARITEKSYRSWRRSFGLAGHLLGNFTRCLAQSERSAHYLRALGAPSVDFFGNLKFAAKPLPADPEKLDALTGAIGDRPRWLAASTHRAEEEIILGADRILREERPDLLTLIVPRHPERGAEVATLAARQGLAVRRRAEGALPDAACAVYVADTIGELGLFYRATDIAFIGGSLVPKGGQNPLEAARLDCALLHGPHMSNFAEVMTAFNARSASREVTDAESLAAAVRDYLDNPWICRDMAFRAAAVVTGGQETLERTLKVIEETLQQGVRP
ncbi:3-deoxy-D-manno-octulosonic acid transferase [Sneathiella sp.]|uniref:3-deoxy-D-manno-octulosonic acid transferase n=1 Tax=Sneathiella sp. TaxID=1964365 RepID=UPI002FE32FD1